MSVRYTLIARGDKTRLRKATAKLIRLGRSATEGMAALEDALQRNTAYMNSTVSNHWKTITLLAEVRDAKPEEKKKTSP